MMATKYKDSGIPWIGEIPSDWDVVRTKNVFACSKSLVGEDWSHTQLLSLTTKGVKEVAIGSTSGKVPDSYETYQVVNKDDLVMCLFDLDCSAVFSGVSNFHGMISPAYKVLKTLDGYSPAFYGYWFDYIFDGRKYKYLSKNIRYSLTYDEFAALGIAAPPLLTQQRIADFLDRKCAEIDELAALQETMIAELKRYKQSVITESVTKGLDPDVPMKDSGVKWIGEIPERWDVMRLKFVANRRNKKADDTNLKYIGLEHIVGFSKEMVETENVYDNEGANMCYNRDVIFGKLRPYLGKAKVIEETCCCSSEFLVLCNVHCPDYLRYLMLSGWFIEIVNASTYGTKMPRANADFIMNMIIPVPLTAEQQQIADYLDRKCAEIDELIAIKQQKIEALKEYKKSVIFEYVTGKKEI